MTTGPITTQDERKAFDAWFEPYWNGPQSDLAAWSAWQARAALTLRSVGLTRHAIQQANKFAQAEMAPYRRAREKEFRDNIKNVVLLEPLQAAEPLTDLQIDDIWHETTGGSGNTIRRFARAIEMAHGIGDKT